MPLDNASPNLTNGVEDLAEFLKLCAVDSDLFARAFFGRTVRQDSAPFHKDIWNLLEGPARYVNIQVFRGGAKTSTCRLYAAKRIAYGLAHTVLYIGKSEGHAARSVGWLRRQIETNREFVSCFGLRPGKKWQDTEAEIWHETDSYPISIMAMGITGSVRGINQDDYRPDLIIVDDVIDEENAATPEQRQKTSNLIYGALKESLTPATEAPDAKMVMLQTPLNKEDASTLALQDPEWRSAVFGCWTRETADLPLELQESSWASRFPSKTLRDEKRAAIQRNNLSVFLREKECRITSPETSAFKEDWLKYYDLAPEQMRVVIVIDPVPPPSEIQIAKGLHKKDFEAFAVVGAFRGKYYLLEYALHRGHEPNWTVVEFFRLCAKWRPFKVFVESTAYQRTLAWLIRQAMETRRQYYVVEEFDDRRSKFDKIVQGLQGPAANGALHVRAEHTDFISQFRQYPDVNHDDLIETVAIAVSKLEKLGVGVLAADDFMLDQNDIPRLEYARGAP